MWRETEIEFLQINFRNVLAEYELCVISDRDERETRKKGPLGQAL